MGAKACQQTQASKLNSGPQRRNTFTRPMRPRSAYGTLRYPAAYKALTLSCNTAGVSRTHPPGTF
jgi:hypothetical protein